MKKKHSDCDRNFDGLAPRFKRNIYESMKGQMRLEILKRDFDDFVNCEQGRAIDVGAGQAYWSMELLKRGFELTLNDVSSEMLEYAKNHIANSDLDDEHKQKLSFSNQPLQSLKADAQGCFDVVCCHAVMEWLSEPSDVFKYLVPLVKPGGWFSLVFYNVHGLIFKNLLRTNFKKVALGDVRGTRGSLTPLNPLDPELVIDMAQANQLSVERYSGIRVFHDYILDPVDRHSNLDQQRQLELVYSTHPAYRSLGRYIHLLCRRSAV